MASAKFHNQFRQLHRWIGFFLAGIMAVYALSGTLLIFRGTDFLKVEKTEQHQLEAGLSARDLGPQLRLRGFRVEAQTDTEIRFAGGSYDKTTGLATTTRKDYPVVIDEMVHMHKANTNSPLFWLNITFGVALLFFCISAFLMFIPRALPFKNGLKIAGVGFIFALLVVVFGS